MPRPLVCVLEKNNLFGWPPTPRKSDPSQLNTPAGAESVAYMTLPEALRCDLESDLHLVQYSAPEHRTEYGGPHRLNAGAEKLIPGGVRMALLIFEIDCDKKQRVDGRAPDAWWAAELPKIEALREDHPGVLAYRSRGGYRLLAWYPERCAIVDAESARQWRELYLHLAADLHALYGIEADPKCSEWQRLQRAPHALRDGVREPGVFVGDPDQVGEWDFSKFDLDRGLEAARELAARELAKNDEEEKPWCQALAFLEGGSTTAATAAAATVDLSLNLQSIIEALVPAVAKIGVGGGRHNLYLALSGVLLDRGVDPDQLPEVVGEISRRAGVDGPKEQRDRAASARTTVSRAAAGKDYQRIGALQMGWPAVAIEIDRVLPRKRSAGERGIMQAFTGDKEEKPLTDSGNAERLVRLFGHRIRYLASAKHWLIFDGVRWRRDATGELTRMARETARDILRTAGEIDDDVKRKLTSAWALKSESARGIAAMIDLARWQEGIVVAPEELDADPMLLNVSNGTLDLRTGELRKHDEADLITKLAPVAWNASATAPLWDRFLERVLPDEETRRFVQRFFGYCLTADVSEHALAMFHGVGANGKSVLLETVRAMMGDYARVADAGVLLARKSEGPRNDIASLLGARLATASETESGRKFAEGVVKSLTGGDTVTARYLFAEFFDFRPTFKLVLSTNYRPQIAGQDVGIWRRMRLVPFNVVIPEAERDAKLGHKLAAELPGILNWALAGCAAWQSEGLGEPAEVRAATAEYRHSQDPIGDFIAANCDLSDPFAKTTTAALYAEYRTYAADNGIEVLGQHQFVDLLPARGLRPVRIGNKGHRGWQGIKISTATEGVRRALLPIEGGRRC